MQVIKTSIFARQAERLFSAEADKNLLTQLTTTPASGRVIAGSGGLRRLQWVADGEDKPDGVRLIYFWSGRHKKIILLYVYPKNIRGNFSVKQLQIVRQYVEDNYL